jgi:hypothetical protein
MMFNVPQFLDIEDKIVGPLTAKQLGWLALGGVTLLVFYNFLDTEAFIIAAAVCALAFGALAFYKPYNQPLISFLMSSVYFVTRPRIYIWKRLPDQIKNTIQHKTKPEENINIIQKKTITSEKIKEISKVLDRK